MCRAPFLLGPPSRRLSIPRSSARSALLALTTAALVASLGAPAIGWAGDDRDHAVLTLQEAASFLRVRPDTLARLVENGEAPGRRLDDEWRFDRAALVRWLAGTSNDSAEESDVPGRLDRAALPPKEMGDLRGRGPDAEQPPARPDDPVRSTAEDVFLRENRVLVGKGQVIIEPMFSYAKGEETEVNGFALQFEPVGTGTVTRLYRDEQETTTGGLGVRYGLQDETEFFMLARYRYRNVGNSSHLGGSTSNEAIPPGDSEGSNHLLRVTMGVRRTLMHERKSLPDLVLSVEGGIPLSATSYLLGAGLFAVKSLDPIAVFAGVEYQHTFSRRFGDLSLLEPENLVGISAGYAFAVNDELTLSTAVSAAITTRTDFGGGLVMRADESYGLRMGVTYMLRRGMYVEPNLTIGLSSPGSWMMFGMSVPITLGE